VLFSEFALRSLGVLCTPYSVLAVDYSYSITPSTPSTPYSGPSSLLNSVDNAPTCSIGRSIPKYLFIYNIHIYEYI
jgi:hypothetical protein